jgi:hypothetical protein
MDDAMNLLTELLAASVPRWRCGHLKIPSNTCHTHWRYYTIDRCLTCKRLHTKEYDERKRK